MQKSFYFIANIQSYIDFFLKKKEFSQSLMISTMIMSQYHMKYLRCIDFVKLYNHMIKFMHFFLIIRDLLIYCFFSYKRCSIIKCGCLICVSSKIWTTKRIKIRLFFCQKMIYSSIDENICIHKKIKDYLIRFVCVQDII